MGISWKTGLVKLNMSKNTVKLALVRMRGNSRLHPLGARVLSIPGAGQVLRRILLGVMPKGKRVWIQIPAGPAKGVWLKIDPYLEAQYISGFPEPAVQAEIARHLRPGGCFYDVGAHIGFYSLMVERLMGGIGQVMAFEPDPNNVIELRENLSRNGFSGTEVVSAAVWSHSGVVKFQRSGAGHPEESTRRGAVVVSMAEPSDPNLIDAEAITLDSFIQSHPAPTMIKVDVEGAEVEVLRGAQELLQKARPVWMFEVHHQTAATLLEENLRQHDYGVKWLAMHPDFPFPRHLLALPAK